MKLKTKLIYLSFISSLFFVISCSNNNNDDDEIYEIGVPINSIEASSTASLEDRKSWVFSVDNIIYKSMIEGKTLTATPDLKIKYFNEKYKEGEVYMGGLMSSLHVYFRPVDYYGLGTKMSTSLPVYPNILNQDTKERLIHADALQGSYFGIISKDIKDLKLTHENSLLDIELINLPTGYKMVIPFSDGKNYTPYEVRSNTFRMVYIKNLSNAVYIQNQAGSIIEEFDLPAKSDVHCTIKVYYNEASNKFTSSTNVSGWSDEGNILLKDIN